MFTLNLYHIQTFWSSIPAKSNDSRVLIKHFIKTFKNNHKGTFIPNEKGRDLWLKTTPIKIEGRTFKLQINNIGNRNINLNKYTCLGSISNIIKEHNRSENLTINKVTNIGQSPDVMI